MANPDHERPRGALIIPTSVTTTSEGPIMHASMVASDREAGEQAAQAFAEATGADVYLERKPEVTSEPTGTTRPETSSNGGKIIGFSKWRAPWTPTANVERALKEAARTEEALRNKPTPPGNPKNN